MNLQTGCYSISAACHILLLLVFVLLTAGAVSRRDIVTIDFTLENCLQQPVPAERTEPSSAPRPPPMPSGAPASQAMIAPPAPVMPNPVKAPPAEPVVQQFAGAPVMQVPLQQVEGTTAPTRVVTGQSMTVSPATVVSTGKNREASADQERKKYLNEQFNYIRDLITKRLTYPAIARKMEWSGKVVLAFVVAEDGSVTSIELKESSGYPILDKSAISTVRSSAPFPPPPVAAEIVIPVLFRLQ